MLGGQAQFRVVIDIWRSAQVLILMRSKLQVKCNFADSCDLAKNSRGVLKKC